MRFAYLVMAHKNVEQLKCLLKTLDWYENDIFLHIDRKCIDISSEQLMGIVKKARINIYRKYEVIWGDISQTQCQMFLLGEAIKTHHDYYHLISGQDLPIKKHNEVLEFFQTNKGKQFIHFESTETCKKEACRYYHFFWSREQHAENKYIKRMWGTLENIAVYFQKCFHIKREFYCGANWFSITHELAFELWQNKDKMLRKVKWTINSDEYILQTFVKNVSLKRYDLYAATEEDDYNAVTREIDWNRGTPYVWRIGDYKTLMTSSRMYARKFDEKIDNEIIRKIFEKVCD